MCIENVSHSFVKAVQKLTCTVLFLSFYLSFFLSLSLSLSLSLTTAPFPIGIQSVVAVTSAVITTIGVDTIMLTGPIVGGAFIDIWQRKVHD